MNFKKKIFLITGGTGSFGNAVLKKILKTNIKEIRILSRDEKKQHDLRKKINDDRLKFYLGDIRDYSSVLDATKTVDYIFHAAALKQVPSCEFFPMEAVNTNIIGANNITKAAEYSGVKKCIMLSTDKAVYPINTMGVTKSLAEKLVISNSLDLSKSKTIICATRYGNVIYSRGSVIPLFEKQILEKNLVTATDLTMTRFMMTMDEAINLVFFAFKNAKNGEIFIKKSPAATLKTIINALSIILQKNPKIKVIGPRHGEKFHESLLSKEEYKKVKNYNGYYKVVSDNKDLNYDKYFSYGKITKVNSDYTSENTLRLSVKETVKMFLNDGKKIKI